MGAPDEEAEGQASPRERKPPEPCGTWFGMALLAGVFAAYGFLPGLAIAVVVVSLALGGRAAWVALVARPRARRGAAGGRLTSGEVIAVTLAAIGAANAATIGYLCWRSLYAAPAVRLTAPNASGIGTFVYAAGVLLLIGAVLGSQRQPRATMRASALALALTGMLGVMVAMAMPLEARDLSAARKSQCLRHVKHLSAALQMYATDYDRYPPAERWSEALSDYLDGDDVYPCPEAVPTFAYAYNGTLDRAQPDAVPAPDRSISIFESDVGRDAHGGIELLPRVPRHRRGDNFGFVDGHAEWAQREVMLHEPFQYGWQATTRTSPSSVAPSRGGGKAAGEPR